MCKLIVSLRNSKKGLTVIEVAVISSMVIALGIFLMLYSAGIFANTTYDLTKETDRNIQLLRGILLIESVQYGEENGEEYAKIHVRNIAKQAIDLTITRIELLISNDRFYDSLPKTPYGFGNLTKLINGEKKILDAPTCPSCHKGENLTYRVWYISSSLYDVENPLLSVSNMLYVEFRMIKPIGAVEVLKCPLPTSNWIMVDYVDPATGAIFGRISTLEPAVYIRPSLASNQIEDMPFTVIVMEDETGRSGSGTASLDVPSIRLERISGTFGGLQTPLRIIVGSSWDVIQREWFLDGLPNETLNSLKLHVSGIYLQWSRIDRTLEGIMLELGLGEKGNYNVRVILRDCYKDVLQDSTITVEVERINDFEIRFIPVSNSVRLDQIYYIETKIEEKR